MQPPVIDALLEIDAHGAECRQRSTPIVARVDVLGVDDRRLAGKVVHGVLLFPCVDYNASPAPTLKLRISCPTAAPRRYRRPLGLI